MLKHHLTRSERADSVELGKLPNQVREGSGMRRIPMAMVAAVLLALGVAACGGTGDSGSSDAGAPVAKGTKLEPADITLWVGFTARELGVIKDTVKEFEAENPQVKVKVV